MSQHKQLDALTYSQECLKILQAYRSGYITAREQQEEFALLRMMFGLQDVASLHVGEQQTSQGQ